MFNSKSLFFHRRILHIALPAFIAQISYPLIGVADTAVMGHFATTDDLVAVNIGSGIFMVFAGAISFLRSSTLGLCAQAWGRGDHQGLQLWAMRSFMIALFVSAIAVLIGYWGFWVFAPNDVAPSLMRPLEDYYLVRLYSLPAHALGIFSVGVFLGLQNARDVLYYMLLVNVLNILLNILFVAGFDFGASGLAWGSVIAEYTGLIYAGLRLKQLRIWSIIPKNKLFKIQEFKRILNLNIHYFIRTICLAISFAVIPIVGASIGTTQAAANVILFNLWFIFGYSLDGLANAAEALVGRAIGRQMPIMLKRLIVYLHSWSIPISVLYLGIFIFFYKPLFILQTNDSLAIEFATVYLPWLMLAIVLSVPCVLLDGIYYGAALGKEVSTTMLVACSVYGLSLWLLPMEFGNHGLWISIIILLVVRAVGLYIFLPRVMNLAVSGK